MPGFNYGGKGDGTGWSSERGDGPPPGGGTGTGGNSGNNSSNRGKSSPGQQQISAIQSDPVVRDKLAALIKAAHILNPSANLNITALSASGTLSISVTGINAEQASTIGLSGLIVGFKYDGGSVAVGNIETGHKLSSSVSSGGRNSNQTLNSILSKSVEDSTPSTPSPRSVWDRTADFYSSSNRISRKALKKMYEDTVRTGSIPKNVQGKSRDNVQKMLDEDKRIADKKIADAAEKKSSEQDALQKSSELIAAMGEKIGEHLGSKYKAVAKEIADNLRNFQGKTIRSYDDAMASLNKILANPAMKINQADKDALINAWKSLNASDMANKIGNLSRAFKTADVLMKVEKVREKSIIGYETGHWEPLVLEVESWVLSGVASGIAMGILAATASTIATTVGLPVTVITIIGIMVISYVASFIDASIAEKINNEVIKPAH